MWQVFIDHILETAGLQSVFSKVYTNPASFDNSGCLHLSPYHRQDWCSMSSVNMCKGHVVDEHSRKSGVKYDVVAYVGDGENDLCPALRLRDIDIVFPRRHYRLDKRIAEGDEKVAAMVRSWDTGFDIMNALEEILMNWWSLKHRKWLGYKVLPNLILWIGRLKEVLMDLEVDESKHIFKNRRKRLGGRSWRLLQVTTSFFWYFYLPPTKEEVHVLPVFVCLSVCMSVSKITQNCMHGFGWNVACQLMDELINFWTWSDNSPDVKIGLLSPILYRLRNFAALSRLPASCAATRNFTSGKSHVGPMARR